MLSLAVFRFLGVEDALQSREMALCEFRPIVGELLLDGFADTGRDFAQLAAG